MPAFLHLSILICMLGVVMVKTLPRFIGRIKQVNSALVKCEEHCLARDAPRWVCQGLCAGGVDSPRSGTVCWGSVLRTRLLKLPNIAPSSSETFLVDSVCTFLLLCYQKERNWVRFKTVGEEGNEIKFPCGPSQLFCVVCI